jgi:signal peptidase I
MATLMKSKFLQLLKNRIAHLLLLLFLLSFVFNKGFKVYYNYGESMEPTLRNHQLMLVNKIWYELVPMERYDIVIIKTLDDGRYCKRIVALPNEIIEIKNGRIFLNDKLLEDDPTLTTYTREEIIILDFPRTELNADEYFYVGDNRDETVCGVTTMDYIDGKIMLK